MKSAPGKVDEILRISYFYGLKYCSIPTALYGSLNMVTPCLQTGLYAYSWIFLKE
jgi:hypothetical protein